MPRIIALLFAALLPLSAAALQKGDSLPELYLTDKGELTLDAEQEIVYVPWSTENLDTKGQVQIIQYMAARPSAEKAIRPFTDKLEETAYPVELHHVTTVVNLDDVTFGASSWALSELEKNKREYPMSTMVADMEGKGLKTWGFEPKGSALIVLDADGKILYVKDGKLKKDEIDAVIKLIGEEVGKRS